LRGKSHLAPIKDPRKALDFGTGTGLWAIEFAQEYPSCDVLGTDLSPIQPLYVPPNCRFEIDDAEDDWLYTQNFDYIHGRLLAVCFKDPATVFQKAFHSLSPRGYFEMFDFSADIRCLDDSLAGTALEKFHGMMIQGVKSLGKDMTRAPKYKEYFRDAGFIDIVEKQFRWPTNDWPKGKYYKSVGLWYNRDLQEGLSGMAMAIFTRGLKMSKEEVDTFLEVVRKDIDDRMIHAYLPL
jgi:SAM-dependent methyltransferase